MLKKKTKRRPKEDQVIPLLKRYWLEIPLEEAYRFHKRILKVFSTRDLFDYFWTKIMLETICMETNAYASIFLLEERHDTRICPGGGQSEKKWTPLHRKELNAFLAIKLHMKNVLAIHYLRKKKSKISFSMSFKA